MKPKRRIKYDTGKRIVNDLTKARNKDDFYLVMEGDDGGQIYLVCPAKLVQCSEDTLWELLIIIDENQWGGQEDMRTLFYEQFKPDEIVPGGMDGGMVLKDDVWVHEEMEKVTPIFKKIIFNEYSEEGLKKVIRKLKKMKRWRKHKSLATLIFG